MEFTMSELDFIVRELKERVTHHRMHYYGIYNQDQEDKINTLEKFIKAIREYGYNLIKKALPTQFPDEANELDRLLKAVKSNLESDLENDIYSRFEIHINNEVITLSLGAPQAEGLYRLIEHIADENFYLVDYNNHEVKGWYEFPVNGAATASNS